MRTFISLFFLGFLFSIELTADDISNHDVTVEGLRYGGSGCPQDSVGVYLSEDKKAMTLSFDQLIADSSRSSSGTDSKNCKVQMRLKSPPGWEYSLFCIDYRGYADLDLGSTGEHEAKFSFERESPISLGRLTLNGPYSDDYSRLLVLPVSGLPYSNCNAPRTLTIDTEVTVAKASASKTISLASSRYRYAETDLGSEIVGMELLKKYSGAICKLHWSFGFNDSKAWVKYGCRADFKVFLESGDNNDASGLMTVDTLDGEVKHHYGIAWRQCSAGRWVQALDQTCQVACRRVGLTPSLDEGGASCVSGEARPSSAIGQINFARGCWGSCSSMGSIKTKELGLFCYAARQKIDFDNTDRTVGCYCK